MGVSFPLRNRALASFFGVIESCMSARFASVLLLLVWVVVRPLQAETTEQVIAKARAYLGTESALDAVRSIHFKGTLDIRQPGATTDPQPQSASQPEPMPVEIFFQKPYQQQMTVTRAGAIDTMVLDDYEGWSRTTSRQNPKQARITLLDVPQIKQLRANTWENLSFFSGLERNGGTVKQNEDVVVDGVTCVKLSFIHSDLIVFHRYFELATGRLIKTETANGSEIREEGELIVDGVRFPKKILNKTASGQVTTIVFDTVVLNERIPASAFSVPSLLTE